MRERFLSPEGDRYRESFEHDFMCLLEKLVNDLERKFRRGKDRLEVALPAPGSDAAWRAGGPGAQSNPLKDDLEDRRTLLDFQVKDLLARIEAYGEEGRITEAQELIVESEACKAELERLRHLDIDRSAGSSEKRMDVCPTCGALLVVNDAQKRVEAHFEGRQHSGWARIRNALAELKAKFASAPRHHAGGAGREPPPRHEHSRPPPRRPMASSFSSFSSSSSSSSYYWQRGADAMGWGAGGCLAGGMAGASAPSDVLLTKDASSSSSSPSRSSSSMAPPPKGCGREGSGGGGGRPKPMIVACSAAPSSSSMASWGGGPWSSSIVSHLMGKRVTRGLSASMFRWRRSSTSGALLTAGASPRGMAAASWPSYSLFT